MLSVKKAKLHGMQDERWVTRDKITQYKGVIGLFCRDRKITETDKQATWVKQTKELHHLQKDIAEKRAELGNVIKGDRQLLRNKLQEHRDMQLKYQDLHPTHVIEKIYQDNFNKRKCLDRLKYKMKIESSRLIDRKLHLSVLEDRLKYSYIYKIPEEQAAELITGKVQDAILKKEAALAAQQIYKAILSIMKKASATEDDSIAVEIRIWQDAIYFEAVLLTLKDDGYNQGVAMITTTELGQLATEYLDDRKQEFIKLEQDIKRDLIAQLESKETVKRQVDELNGQMRFLVRRDSDINVGKLEIEPTASEENLQKDILYFEKRLLDLQESTAVRGFDKIYPCMEQQREHNERLKEFIIKADEERDRLLNKKNHAEIMTMTLKNTMLDTTQEYVEKKKQVAIDIEQQKERKRILTKKQRERDEILTTVRQGLTQLYDACRLVTVPGVHVREIRVTIGGVPALGSPVEMETDGRKLIELLKTKLTTLMSAAQISIQETQRLEAEQLFQTFIQRGNKALEFQVEALGEESLIELMSSEEAGVPTRNDIKLRSEEIVEQHQKSDFDDA